MSKEVSIEKVLQKAEEAVERLDYFIAAKFYQRALEMEPKNTHIMDDYAQTLLELGETEKATQLLKESITLDPMGGYEKYMNMGQILVGKEAVESFDRGIQLMTSLHAQTPKNDRKKLTQLSVQISSAFCSIAEIYLTDLCMEEGAEKECERSVESAIKWNANNVEVLVIKANLLMSQNKLNDATNAIRSSYSLWKETDETKWPAYAIQLQTAKIMIELAMSEDATEILELLVEQEDENAEVWFLLGLCYFGPSDTPLHPTASYDCLCKARDLLTKMGERRPPGALEQVDELLTKVTPFYEKEKEEDDNNIDDEMDDEEMDD